MIFILFLIQTTNYTIENIESFYINSSNFTSDSISNYKTLPNFNDLEKIFLRKKPYKFKNETFNLWSSLRFNSFENNNYFSN